MRWALALVALGGCWPLKTPTMKEAWKLEKAGDFDQAESTWAKAMEEHVTLQEWKIADKHRCSTMRARLEPVVQTLDPDSLTLERAVELRETLASCTANLDLAEEVLRVELQVAARALSAMTDRLGADPRYDPLAAAWPLLAHLGPEHPARTPWNEARAVWVEQLRARRDALRDAPVTKAWLTVFERRAAPDTPSELPSLGRAATVLDIAELSREIELDSSCTDLLGDRVPPLVRHDVDAPHTYAVRATLSDCTTSTGSTIRDVHYTETRYRTEIQTVTRSETSYHTRIGYEPSSLECTGSVCTYTPGGSYYETVAITHTWTEEVEVQVPYEVELTRKGLFPQRYFNGTFTVTVTAPFGTEQFILPLKAFVEGRELSPDADGSTFAFHTPSVEDAADTAAAKVSSTLDEPSYRHAYALRVAQLRRRASDRDEPEAAREAILALAARDHPISEEEAAFVASLVDVPAELVLDPYASLPFRDPPDLVLRPEPRIWVLPRIDSIVSNGFPPFQTSFGYARAASAALPAHDPSIASGVRLGLDAHHAIGTHARTRGLVLHGTAAGHVFFQRRISDDYVFPPPPENWAVPNEEERRFSLGYRVSVGLLTGIRLKPFALLAGVRPAAAGHLIGFYNTAGTAVMPTARLELRFVQRYPILIDAWGGPSLAGASTMTGAQLAWPLPTKSLYLGNYLTFRSESVVMPAQVKGATSSDTLDAGPVELRSWSIGIGGTL